jgi:hypothetical protein
MLQLLLHKLPVHIVHHILSYSYNVQSKKLLSDIKNYYATKQLLFESQPHTFILHDLHYFINWFQADYVYSYYSTFLRHYMISSIASVLQYIDMMQRFPLQTQINIIWGLMRPDERNEFLSITMTYNKIKLELGITLE